MKIIAEKINLKPWRNWALAAFAFVAFCHIVSSVYAGVNNNRAAAVYAHILGFTGAKGFGEPYGLFNGGNYIFDIPIYQFLIAKTALAASVDPLAVSRYFNLALWLMVAFAGYRLCRRFAATDATSGVLAGCFFVFLLSTTPLVSRYFSTPLPDTMAIAFSLTGVAILCRAEGGVGWKTASLALPFLTLATLIKSPVPFVFVVFHVVRAAFHATPFSPRRALTEYMPTAALLILLFACALFAEQLRGLLRGREFERFFLEGPAWYFGDWATRTSAEFWAVVWNRLRVMGPSAFGHIYIAVVAAALAISRDRRHIATTTAAVAAFFAGWLTFSGAVYIHHDYYQLPLAVILFMSFAVSMSRVLSFAIGKLPARLRQAAAAAALASMIPVALAYAVAREPPYERRAGIFVGMEHALREEERFLLVRPAKHTDTLPGAQVSTKYTAVTADRFEAECERYLKEWAAVVAWHRSECLRRNRQHADWFIEDDSDWWYADDGVIMFYMSHKR